MYRNSPHTDLSGVSVHPYPLKNIPRFFLYKYIPDFQFHFRSNDKFFCFFHCLLLCIFCHRVSALLYKIPHTEYIGDSWQSVSLSAGSSKPHPPSDAHKTLCAFHMPQIRAVHTASDRQYCFPGLPERTCGPRFPALTYQPSDHFNPIPLFPVFRRNSYIDDLPSSITR